jgi:hypothetical protein
MVRIVDIPEPVPRPELSQVTDVCGDGSTIAVVLRRQHHVQVIESAALPLCNTGERPNRQPSATKTTFRATIEPRPPLRRRSVPLAMLDLVIRAEVL